MVSPAPSKTQRLLDLVALLVSRRQPIPRGEIWDRVVGYRQSLDEGTDPASVRRTFERDKKELLELGFPLETVEVPGNDPEEQQLYRLDSRDFYLPYLRLVGETGELAQTRKPYMTPLAAVAPEDAFAVARALTLLRDNEALAFQADARSAFRKLTFDLVGDIDDPFGAAPVIVPADDEATRGRIPGLARAIRTRRVVRFRYRGPTRDEPTDREVEPWSLLFKQSRWYLVGHDRVREARRIFRVSRIEELEAWEEGPPEFERPDVDLSMWDDAEAWDLPGMEEPAVEVTVRFHFPRSLWAERNRVGELVEREAGGAALRRFRVRSAGPFLRWLLGQLDEVEIVEPDDYAEELEAIRRRVIAANPGLFRADVGGDTGGRP
jgi:predicted DNA-binding transcriptional regulator YafY